MLDIDKYTQKCSMWPMIKKYMDDHSNTYKIESRFDDKSYFNHIIVQAKCTINHPTEFDTFKRSLRSLQTHINHTLKRDNQLRLCFALNLSSINDANILFTEYLHTNELSPRSLKEFIAICGLNCHLKWNDVFKLQQKFREEIENQPSAPAEINDSAKTFNFLTNTIPENIHSYQDIVDYISEPMNLTFFAKTRNQHYQSLFSDITYRVVNGKVVFVDEINTKRLSKGQPRFLSTKMRSYYNRLFLLYSSDDKPDVEYNHLTIEEVKTLIPIFPDVFMTYDNFRDLVQRRRTVDISSGTFLLHYLLTAPADDTSDDEYVDFTQHDAFIESCNDALFYGAFPYLNENNSFDALVMDVYEETLEMNSGLTSLQMKLAFLTQLRSYLKEFSLHTHR